MIRIKYLRIVAGLSQRELARRAKVSPGYISNVERHGMILSYDQAKRVARVLGWQDDPMRLFDEVELMEVA